MTHSSQVPRSWNQRCGKGAIWEVNAPRPGSLETCEAQVCDGSGMFFRLEHNRNHLVQMETTGPASPAGTHVCTRHSPVLLAPRSGRGAGCSSPVRGQVSGRSAAKLPEARLYLDPCKGGPGPRARGRRVCKPGVTSRRHLGDQIRGRRAVACGAGRDLRVCSLIGTWEEAEAPLRPEVGRQGYGLRHYFLSKR